MSSGTAHAADREVRRAGISVEVADVDAVHAETLRRGMQIVYRSPMSRGVSAGSVFATPTGSPWTSPARGRPP